MLEDAEDAEDAADSLMVWYEVHWLFENDQWIALHDINRPIRELVVTHQAWGLIHSDGLNSYFCQYDSRFDREVESGLRLLDLAEAYPWLVLGRNLFDEHVTSGIQPKEETDHWRGFMKPLDRFEVTVGEFLLGKL